MLKKENKLYSGVRWSLSSERTKWSLFELRSPKVLHSLAVNGLCATKLSDIIGHFYSCFLVCFRLMAEPGSLGLNNRTIKGCSRLESIEWAHWTYAMIACQSSAPHCSIPFWDQPTKQLNRLLIVRTVGNWAHLMISFGQISGNRNKRREEPSAFALFRNFGRRFRLEALK